MVVPENKAPINELGYNLPCILLVKSTEILLDRDF